jgi:threonine/homoserine/homoserine lactone efflux protein
MSLETLTIFALSIALLYIKPGPNQAMKITRALNDGFFLAWFFTLGATSTVIFYFIIAGLSATIAQIMVDTIGFYFKLLGGLYLLYLGYKGFTNIEKGVWKGRVDQNNKRAFFENYGLGVVMTLANPITIFYFVGIVPNFIELGTLGWTDILYGVGIIIIVGNMADILLITLVTQVKEALSDTKFVQRINIFTSIGFIMIGAFFLYSAIFLSDFKFEIW